MKSVLRTLPYLLLALLFCVVAVPPAAAQDESVRPGINKCYEKVDVEKTAKQYERESRDLVQHRDEIVAGCKLKPGMDVADVGAGTGLFTRPFAAKVAPDGKVYAVDITK